MSPHQLWENFDLTLLNSPPKTSDSQILVQRVMHAVIQSMYFWLSLWKSYLHRSDGACACAVNNLLLQCFSTSMPETCAVVGFAVESVLAIADVIYVESALCFLLVIRVYSRSQLFSEIQVWAQKTVRMFKQNLQKNVSDRSNIWRVLASLVRCQPFSTRELQVLQVIATSSILILQVWWDVQTWQVQQAPC